MPALPNFVAFALPSVLTLSAIACSLTAVRAAEAQHFSWSGGLIILAAVCDALDGHVARYLNAVTVFGGELDSLCDLVNFGVSPALVMNYWAKEAGSSAGDLGEIVLWISCIVFCQCCAVRLARFNCGPSGPASVARDRCRTESDGDASPTTKARKQRQYVAKSKFFTGVPAPMGALVALLPMFWELETGSKPFLLKGREVAVPVLLMTAFLMVSTVKTLSSKMLMRDPTQDTHLRTSSSVEALGKASGVVVLCALAYTNPWRIVLFLELTYFASLVVGPFVYLYYAKD